MSAEAKDLLSPALTAIVVGIGTVITQKINQRRGTAGDAGRKTELSELKMAIRDNHLEMRSEVHELRETLSIRLDQVECVAEDAQRDATKALTAAIGIDGQNGIRGDHRKLEVRVGLLEEDRRVGPAERRIGK